MRKRFFSLQTLLACVLALTFSCMFSLTGFAQGDNYKYFGALEDYQDALTDQQETELLELLDDTARKIQANVGVVLADADMDGMTERSYTRDFHDRCFGEYSDSITLMLVKAGSGKVDQIYCTDSAYDRYNSRINSIFNAVYDGLDSSGGDNYYAAIQKYCSYLDTHSSSYSNPGSNSDDYSSSGVSIGLNIGSIFGIILALIIAIVVTSSTAASYKKRAPISASAYMDSSRTNFTQKSDVFIREYTTSHKISSSSSGGSHHGGGSHHSGGHRSGGGGGRRR